MKTKTFKIGEYCKGGVITAQVTSGNVIIIAKDWDTSAGWNKGSNQSNAKEFNRITVQKNNLSPVEDFLMDLTTSYYTEQVLDWVKKSL